ncbi:DUF2894 domain-containing protein [Stenotrophomonas mori]|uniref:DUF2894 domain-containing protein n=1 Tax=Stenotrophomonas mori TaxID=2871096 RepID=A0ABT0SHJ9_9GAMM|nr:DUF2894 domain-containing protein [Stenotrophomonas mori]MCL7714805.1 DUF2894 domain-containing protein [Stenotrophomonas mori]
MPAEAGDVHARLEAWRQQGADRIDPLRFALMTALAQRAARHDGALRRRLDTRLRVLADAYAALPPRPQAAEPPRATETSPLKQVLDRFGRPPRPDAPAQVVAALPSGGTGDATPAADLAAPMPVLDEFQQLWTRIRIDSLLRQCLDDLPEDAGPLHSRVLTYRAMAVMREVCPDYLQHFVAYTDALSWLEQLGGIAAAGSDADGAASPRKPARAGGRRKK